MLLGLASAVVRKTERLLRLLVKLVEALLEDHPLLELVLVALALPPFVRLPHEAPSVRC